MTVEKIDIPKYKISYLQEKITKLNRKAVKLGCEEMVLTIDNEHTIEYNEHPISGRILLSPLVVEMVTATLNFEIPSIKGYSLVATLDIFPGENENKVLISAVPEKTVPVEYQSKNEIHCDHCGWKRNRHHSVLLEKDGEYIEVGSTCVKDFFDGNDPRGFMFYASLKFEEIIGSLKDDEDMVGGYGGRQIWSFGLKEVLSVTSAVIRKFGWLSKGKAYENGGEATAYKVFENVNPSADFIKYHKDELVIPDEKDIEASEACIEYFENLDAEDNDYLLNCTKIADLGYVPYKYLGFACSMIPSHYRVLHEAEEKKNTLPSEFVGELGDRIKNIRVKVLFTKNIETYYGLSTLYIFQDALGNIMKSFYSGSKWEYDKDDEILITGTVKKHETYNGKKNTMLNRVIAKDAPEDLITVDEFCVA